MAAVESLLSLIKHAMPKLSKLEVKLVEGDILRAICYELKQSQRLKYEEYFHLIQCDNTMEIAMLDQNFIKFLIKDILVTGEYDLMGIALYTQTPADVVYDIVIGSNTMPSAEFLQRIIELHRSIKPEKYELLIQKMIEKWKQS